MKKRRSLIAACAIFVAIITVCNTSCASVTADPFEYINQAFSVLVSGEADGLSFSAEVYCNANADRPHGVILTATLSSPESLDGIVITRYADGHTSARLSDIELDADGFVYICDVLMRLIPSPKYSRVERDGEITKFYFAEEVGEIVYFFNEDSSLPRKISGQDFSFDILSSQ